MGGVNVTNANHVDTGQRHVATLVWSIDPSVQSETRKHMNNGEERKQGQKLEKQHGTKMCLELFFYVRVY